MRKARSSVKKRKKKATVDRRVHISRRKVKMNQPIRKRPKESRKVLSLISWRALSIAKPGVRIIAKEIQKPPYDDRAVAPKVLPIAISLVSC
jgi:hypothetical protein